jgi:hypothetical protein
LLYSPRAAGAVVTAWEGAVNKISGTVLEASAGEGAGGGFLKGISAGLGVDVTGMADAAIGADMQKIQAERDRLNKALGLGPENVTEEAKASAAATTGATADAAREFLDGLDQTMQDQSSAIGSDLRDRVSGGGQRANDEAARLQAELDALAAQAKAAKEAAAAGDLVTPELALDGGAAGMKQSSFATFSAAAAIAFGGGGGGIAQRQFEETRAMRRLLETTNAEIQKLNAKPRGGLRE